MLKMIRRRSVNELKLFVPSLAMTRAAIRNASGVTPQYVREGRYELVVANERQKARVHLEPLHDPLNARVKS